MEQSYTSLNHLETKKSNQFLIKIRVLNIWSVYKNTKDEKTKRVLKDHVGNEHLFVDVQGHKIVAFVKKSNIDRFSNLIEGQTYVVSNFGVVNYTGNYRYCHHQYKIMFYYTTFLQQVQDNEIPATAFSFIDYEHILNRELDEIYSIDVIGLLIGVGDIVETMVDKDPNNIHKRIEIQLQNLRGEIISCTLWDKFVEKISLYVKTSSHDVVVVVLQCARIKYFQNVLKVGNAVEGTKLFINDDNIPEINDFMKSLSTSGLVGTEPKIAHIESSTAPSPSDIFLNTKLWKTIENIQSIQKDFKCVTIATVDDIEDQNGWYYNSCKDCKKKVDPYDGSFRCEACNRTVKFPVPRFRIELRVSDHTSSTSFVLFDKEVENVLQKSVLSFLDSKKTGEINEVPSEFHCLIGKKYLFYIDIKKFSYEKGCSYTVSKMSSDPLLIKEFLSMSTKNKDGEEVAVIHLSESNNDSIVTKQGEKKLKKTKSHEATSKEVNDVEQQEGGEVIGFQTSKESSQKRKRNRVDEEEEESNEI